MPALRVLSFVLILISARGNLLLGGAQTNQAEGYGSSLASINDGSMIGAYYHSLGSAAQDWVSI